MNYPTPERLAEASVCVNRISMIKTINPVDRHIGARIRMRRMQLGISQEKLAEPLNLTFQQVQKYEKGMNRVGGSRMAQIAQILQVDVGFFFQDTPDASGEAASRSRIDSVMDEFMATKDGLMIAQAFVRIPNPEVRAAIAGFVRRIGNSQAAKDITLVAAE